METLGEHRLVARNTATASANKIHDDAVARRFGFGGGLVPGVDVYAYMAHVPADAWGAAWLERGSLRARFVAPVYEGDDVVIVPGAVASTGAGSVIPLELRTASGGVCAVGEAGLPDDEPDAPSPEPWAGAEPPGGPAPAAPPAASPDNLRPGTVLGLAAHVFRADRAGEYLGEIGETLPLFDQHGFAHPGWLLRDANYVLSTNVALGPWIHVESVTQHHGAVRDGDHVDARAQVTREWEHRGHRFVELDVRLVADRDRLVARIDHTAIYRPRQAEG
jgi:acyl dehydratase